MCEWRLPPYRSGVDLDLRTVKTHRYKLTVDLLSGAGELYDMKNDPLEKLNRFDEPDYSNIRRELLDIINSRPGSIMDPLPKHVAPGGA